MKFDVRSIVRDHCLTLLDRQGVLAAVVDLLSFFGVPMVLSIIAGVKGFTLKPEAYNVSITFFGIFIALLLNIQVAIFSIFQRKWIAPSNTVEAKIQQGVIEVRRVLLGELNANISYLVLVCCAALVLAICAYVAEWKNGVAPAVTAFLYLHFILTLLMVIKRFHALFQQEYKRE